MSAWEPRTPRDPAAGAPRRGGGRSPRSRGPSPAAPQRLPLPRAPRARSLRRWSGGSGLRPPRRGVPRRRGRAVAASAVRARRAGARPRPAPPPGRRPRRARPSRSARGSRARPRFGSSSIVSPSRVCDRMIPPTIDQGQERRRPRRRLQLWRRASLGSTRVARRAGRYDATRATAASSRTTLPAEKRQPHPPGHHEAHHVSGVGTHRHANCDLLRALARRVGDDALDAEGGENQGDGAEGPQEGGREAGVVLRSPR